MGLIFDDHETSKTKLDDDEAFDLIKELSANTPEEVRRRRAHFRLTIKASVIVQPGNASDVLKFKVRGVTGDVSEGGCSGMFPIALQVGDVYRLQFDRTRLDLPLIFARCVRCRLVREDAFEAGFAFFTRITLPEEVTSESTASAAR